MDNRHNHTPNHLNTDLDSDRHLTNVANVETVAPEPVAYEEGYIHGRASERSLEDQHQQVRGKNNAARGLLLGIALTSLVGLTVGALFYFTQREESPTPASPVLVPVPSSPQEPNRETTIIERTTERVPETAPINQEPPTTSQESQPDIRVIVPRTEQQQAPAPQNITPQTAPSPVQQQPLVADPSAIQPNTAPQPSPASPQNPTNTDTSTTTQPNTSDRTLPSQPQNQTPTGTAPTTQSNTTDQTSSDGQIQDQTQPADVRADQ
ncbi:MAG: hypothetical protein AB1589_22465 [Cyanobacteriota bacterium]